MTRINCIVCKPMHKREGISGLNRNCFPKIKDILGLAPPPTGSHVHHRSGSVKERVQNRHVVTTHH